MRDFKVLVENLIYGKAEEVKRLARKAILEGISPQEILDKGLIVGMNEVGKKFKNGEFYVPEVLVAARAMHAGMDILKPLLTKSDMSCRGTLVIGTVRGDLHDLGKNLVAMMFEGAGFKVIDLGVDVPSEKFILAAKENKADIVGMSALLTTTMPAMRDTIDLIRKEGLNVKTMVGGAPLTQSYADRIGADGYAPDCVSAVDKAKEILGIKG